MTNIPEGMSSMRYINECPCSNLSGHKEKGPLTATLRNKAPQVFAVKFAGQLHDITTCEHAPICTKACLENDYLVAEATLDLVEQKLFEIEAIQKS